MLRGAVLASISVVIAPHSAASPNRPVIVPPPSRDGVRNSSLTGGGSSRGSGPSWSKAVTSCTANLCSSAGVCRPACSARISSARSTPSGASRPAASLPRTFVTTSTCRSPISPAANTAAVAGSRGGRTAPSRPTRGHTCSAAATAPMGLEPVAPDEVGERPDRRAVAALGEDAAALQRRHRLDDQPVQPPRHRFGRRKQRDQLVVARRLDHGSQRLRLLHEAAGGCVDGPGHDQRVPRTTDKTGNDRPGRRASEVVARIVKPAISPETLREHVRDRRGEGAQVHRRVGDRHRGPA